MTLKELVEKNEIVADTIDIDVWNEELDDFEDRIGFEGNDCTLADVAKHFKDFCESYKDYHVNDVCKTGVSRYSDGYAYVNIEIQNKEN